MPAFSLPAAFRLALLGGLCVWAAFAKTGLAQAGGETGFRGSGTTGPNGERPLVVATASIFADMAEVIGGDAVRVRAIVPRGGDPHTYEPTPESATLVTSAALILRNGLTFEGWLDELIRYSGTRARVARVTEGIAPLGSLTYAGSEDPHAWMDAGNGLVYAENVYRALAAAFPDYADQFAFNYGIYRQQLVELDRWIRDTVAVIPPQQRVLITSHDAFQYYGRAYGLRLESVLGTSTDADAQTADVARVVDLIREAGVPAVFVESTINPKLIRQIAEDTGARVGGSLFSDSLGEPGGPGDTYLGMLRHNTRTIVRGLTGRAGGSAEDAATGSEDPFDRDEGSLPLLAGTLLGVFALGFAIMFRYGQA